MLSKQLELTNGISPLNSLMLSIHSRSDSSENLTTEECEESQSPEIQKLQIDLNEPYNDTIKNSCDAAIASYLKSLPQEGSQNHHSTEIGRLQQHVVDTLQNSLRREHRISVIEDCRKPCTCCYIVPPYLLQKVHQVEQIREDLSIGQVSGGGCLDVKEKSLRMKRKVRNISARAAKKPSSQPEAPISVYNAQHKERLPGKFVTSNTEEQSSKRVGSTARKVLNEAQQVHHFWLKNFGLNSFDGNGGEIKSTVHFGHRFANAFWDGEQMVFGDGDKYFQNLTQLSIMGHEFGHAVTGDKLNYEGEAGALNEHLSDVWGSLVVQFNNRQMAHQATWLIGEESLHVGNKKYAIRSMKSPGTAYDSPILGKDPQPSHYSQRYKGEEDNGGVHINSGIPNLAFCLFALAQGGYAWEKAGRLWYLTMQTEGLIQPNCTMHEFAQATIYTAIKHYPTDYKMHQDLTNAWKAVGLT